MRKLLKNTWKLSSKDPVRKETTTYLFLIELLRIKIEARIYTTKLGWKVRKNILHTGFLFIKKFCNYVLSIMYNDFVYNIATVLEVRKKQFTSKPVHFTLISSEHFWVSQEWKFIIQLHSTLTMAIPDVEFSKEGYKIRKVFG